MTRVDDLRRALEAAIGNMTPARAQELAKSFLEPGAAKEQVAKTAADILDWSQRNRERLTDVIRREVTDQMKQVGVATQDDLDTVRKRVRELERRAGMTASGRARARRKTTTRKSTARKSTAKKPTAAKRSAAKPADGPDG
jgi:polyhydroxyalkanoate synthesis regulator phasin